MDAFDPPVQITENQTLDGSTAGNISVASDATLTLAGQHTGAINVDGGGTLVVSGTLEGPLTIDSRGTATVTGQVTGSVEIRVAGTLVVEPTGRIVGDTTNFGSFTNRGVRTGRVEGRTPDEQSVVS